MNLSQDEINALLNGDAVDFGAPASDETSDADSLVMDSPGASTGETSGIVDALNAGFNLDNDIIVDENSFSPEDYALSELQIDILGEIGNMCMGAVATTMYTLLGRPVSITTPRVSVHSTKGVLSVYKIPFVVVQVEYTEGITGNNLLVLKEEDAALITDLLMGGDGVVEQPVQLDELHLSAISEIMNQMMGASATSLSKLLDIPINISPPLAEGIDYDNDVSDKLNHSTLVIKVSFDMEIEGLLKSELLQLMPYQLGIDLASRMLESGMGAQAGASEVPDSFLTSTPGHASGATVAPQAAASEPAAPQQAPAPYQQPPGYAAPPPGYPPADPYGQPPGYPPPQQQGYGMPPGYPPPQQGYGMPPGYPPPQQGYGMPPGYPPPQQGYGMPPGYPPQPGALVDVHAVQYPSFDSGSKSMSGDQAGMDLVYDIPLSVTVELGRAKREINDILKFGIGTLIVLEKTAGDPVEVIVNGKMIARGEVVVIDDSYGVRITEILNTN